MAEELGNTILSGLSNDRKRSIAEEILRDSSDVSITDGKSFRREQFAGIASIIIVYLTARILLSLPYLIFHNKFDAWLVSNFLGFSWLFYHGYTVGKIAGRWRILVGLLTSSAGLAFLIVSYLLYA